MIHFKLTFVYGFIQRSKVFLFPMLLITQQYSLKRLSFLLSECKSYLLVNQMTIHIWAYFWHLCSVVPLCSFEPTPRCFNYYNITAFIVSQNLMEEDILFILFMIVLALYGLCILTHSLESCLPISTKNKIKQNKTGYHDFDQGDIEFTDEFEKN